MKNIKLAKKYRPKTFKDVIGQEPVVRVLKASIIQNRYGSAYLFSGPYGDGKTTLSRIFAKAVLCDAPEDGEPCCACESCLLFEDESHFGYMELDAASYGGKDDMVSLRDDASSLSVSKKKIINIDESHDITKQGQDALLKQTEECPEHLIYEFCTTDPDKMRSTLRDRCMEFHITKVTPVQIAERLIVICDKEEMEYHEDAIQVIAERSGGHVRSAINLLEEVAYVGSITLENLNMVSRDFEEDIFIIISNLGIDVEKVINTYQSISSYLSSFEFYNMLLSMVTDATTYLYGYTNFSQKRLNFLIELKEVHGFSLVEFLNYLITRDKYVEKVGLQSDLIVLNYKFGASNFIPRIQQTQKISNKTQTDVPSKNTTTISPLSYAELSKLSIKERNALLRQQKKRLENQKLGDKEKSEIVPHKWPLPKEDRPGNTFESENLSAEVFSKNLVGGRIGENRSVVDSGTE